MAPAFGMIALFGWVWWLYGGGGVIRRCEFWKMCEFGGLAERSLSGTCRACEPFTWIWLLGLPGSEVGGVRGDEYTDLGIDGH